MTVHQTSHKPRLWQQYPHRMFVFITLRVPKYFDQGRHISQKKKILLHHGLWFFQWSLEDLRVHYSEAPNAY